jgi:hypothetical protein
MSWTDKRWLALLGLALALAAATIVAVRIQQTDASQDDIHSVWEGGNRILAGDNPYAEVLSGDMSQNRKYATYFPLLYELSSLTTLAGLRAFEQWLIFWRVIFFLCDLGIAITIFALLYRRQQYLAAFFGACFWLFGRWTLHVIQISHVDFAAILPLLVSLAVFRKHRRTSLLLYSLSLAMKHLGIVLVPLYLIWIWQTAKKDALKQVLLGALIIATIPLLVSMPFVAWNALALVKSILFEATRRAESHFYALSLDALLHWRGAVGRLPMVALMAVVFVLAGRKKIGFFTSVLFVMVTFLDFNSVIFRQYMVWAAPFIPLVLCDFADVTRREEGRSAPAGSTTS